MKCTSCGAKLERGKFKSYIYNNEKYVEVKEGQGNIDLCSKCNNSYELLCGTNYEDITEYVAFINLYKREDNKIMSCSVTPTKLEIKITKIDGKDNFKVSLAIDSKWVLTYFVDKVFPNKLSYVKYWNSLTIDTVVQTNSVLESIEFES